ncbi:hypothetical protein [Ruegeria arenilitoris]|uniref:hypothetical protein n=1 Tax=Ruegeria arenilitoris TaxID=1173585 RepID=UPI00147E6004|nr:hypothetical protein [Ruegeria arenilitoris]
MSTFSSNSENLSGMDEKRSYHPVGSFLSLVLGPLRSVVANLAKLLLVLVDRSRYLLWHLYVVQISKAEQLGWNVLENGKSPCRNPLTALAEISAHAAIVALIWGWI